ncbi:MAG: TRAP transporter large permease subunit, partial [Gammaproteobacteria bacterium]|nr:TRAP transporter large permease subunit [Gammaproteobacteria bacterium]
VPALTAQGVEPLVANMFVFYFALLSHITPPVCLAIFAGAQIAGANIWETAWMGVKMSAVAYILPFLVVFAPSLLLIGTPYTIIFNTVTSVIGFALIISAIQGWALFRLNLLIRLTFLAAGVCFIWPALIVKGVGAVIAAILLTLQLAQRLRELATSS